MPLAVAADPAQPFADPVLEWNVNALNAISTATTSGLIGSRWAAIVHAAVYDAVISFTRDAEPYARIHVSPPPAASVDAAAIAAAHFALVSLLPSQQSSLDALYASSLLHHATIAQRPSVRRFPTPVPLPSKILLVVLL